MAATHHRTNPVAAADIGAPAGQSLTAWLADATL